MWNSPSYKKLTLGEYILVKMQQPRKVDKGTGTRVYRQKKIIYVDVLKQPYNFQENGPMIVQILMIIKHYNVKETMKICQQCFCLFSPTAVNKKTICSFSKNGSGQKFHCRLWDKIPFASAWHYGAGVNGVMVNKKNSRYLILPSEKFIPSKLSKFN